MEPTYLAADFGGGSGRIIAGHIKSSDGKKILVMKEIHRFSNQYIRIGGYLYWDFPMLYSQLIAGLSKAAKACDVVSIGIDTWGVDFGLVDKLGNLIGNPICYRDNHTEDVAKEFIKNNDISAHYQKIGIQILHINTLFRLKSMVKAHDPKLEIAHQLLFMPDLFSYYLTGKGGNEYTIASTSELLDAKSKTWDYELIRSMGIDPSLFGNIIMPGESRGNILGHIANETGLPEKVQVIAVGSHDTASAVFAAAEDYEESQTAFISSGTWSLLGVLLDTPILTDEARKLDYTNEGGVGGKITFLSNITGLWILQRLKAQWEERGLAVSWSELITEAEKSSDCCVIDVDDPLFRDPDNMEEKIIEYCRQNGLNSPGSRGEMVRCVCISLAHRYKRAIDDLNKVLPSPVKRIKIFGGGSNNSLLNRLTAIYTGLEVVKGPIEATAIGNLLTQAIAYGSIKDKSEISEIIEL